MRDDVMDYQADFHSFIHLGERDDLRSVAVRGLVSRLEMLSDVGPAFEVNVQTPDQRPLDLPLALTIFAG